MADQTLRITGETFAELAALRAEEKFHAHDFYSGAPDEDSRLYSERAVNRWLYGFDPDDRLGKKQ